MSFKKANRWFHKWISICISVPLLVVLVTGVLLLLKKQIEFIQPPTMKGSQATPTILFEDILSVAQNVSEANIDSWQDIDRLDVRPDKGIIKIRSVNSVEVQIDAVSGDVLHVAVRRSDLIEQIHDGTFFEKNANLWLMLPVAIFTILVLITGVILFVQPYLKRKKRPIN